MSKPSLVAILKDNVYARFVGKQQTHLIQNEGPLSLTTLERFRVDPDSVLSPTKELSLEPFESDPFEPASA